MTDTVKNYGLVQPVITSEHYVLGSSSTLPKTILQPNGDWTDFLPDPECQDVNFETDGCTVFGTMNALETLLKRLVGRVQNKSDRFTYILANVTPPGSDCHLIAEIIRKNGVIDDALLPMVQTTLAEYNTPKPMSQNLIDKGIDFINQYDFGHEWVFSNSPTKETRVALLKEALQYSPVCVAVTAWIKQGDVYVDAGRPNTHWVCCFALHEENGEYYPMIFDSYPPYIKKLHPDHHIGFAKRYFIGPSTRVAQVSIIKKMLNLLFELLLIARAHGGQIGQAITTMFR